MLILDTRFRVLGDSLSTTHFVFLRFSNNILDTMAQSEQYHISSL